MAYSITWKLFPLIEILELLLKGIIFRQNLINLLGIECGHSSLLSYLELELADTPWRQSTKFIPRNFLYAYFGNTHFFIYLIAN